MSKRTGTDLKYLVEVENQARFQHLVHELTDHCWELCVDKPASRLDRRSETCLTNCVERFIDTTNFVVNRVEATANLKQGYSGEFQELETAE
ncbi:Mitochondrial import inner membrane translocase subunit Tim8 A [Chamberlinius hualienensis]